MITNNPDSTKSSHNSKPGQQPVRVLFVARSTSTHTVSGGMENSFESVAAHLIAQGYEVSLVTTPPSNNLHAVVPYRHVWHVEGCKPGKYSVRWWMKVQKRRSPWLLWKPHVIFSVSNAASSLALNRSQAMKILAQCHGTALAEVRTSLRTPSPREFAKLPLNLSRILREIFFYRRIRQTISIGDAVSAQLLASPIHLKDAQLTTIQNGVDALSWEFDPDARSSIRSRYGIADDARVGIFNARLHPHKGADIAIEALTRMGPGSPNHLFVCGDGPAASALKKIARGSQAADRIHFTGRLSPSLLSEHMSASDVCIFPTRRHEGLPLNLLEALANGLEVITVQSAGLPAVLGAHVHVVPLTAEGVAREWKVLHPSSLRKSRLTADFTSSYSLNAYTDLVDRHARSMAEEVA